MYTYAANVWDLSLVQGPFSVAPRPNLRVPIRVHFFVAGEGFTALSECVVLPPTYVDSALWPAWLRIALTEPVFLHFTTGARPASPARSLPLLLPPTCPQGTTGWSQRHFPHLTWKKWDHQVALGVCCKFIPLARQHTLTAPRFFFFLMQGFAWAIRGPKSNPLWTRNYTSWTRSSPTSAEPPALRH